MLPSSQTHKYEISESSDTYDTDHTSVDELFDGECYWYRPRFIHIAFLMIAIKVMLVFGIQNWINPGQVDMLSFMDRNDNSDKDATNPSFEHFSYRRKRYPF